MPAPCASADSSCSWLDSLAGAVLQARLGLRADSRRTRSPQLQSWAWRRARIRRERITTDMRCLSEQVTVCMLFCSAVTSCMLICMTL